MDPWRHPQPGSQASDKSLCDRVYLFGSSLDGINICPAPLRFGFWAAGLLIDIGTPLTTLKIQKLLPRLSSSHLPERFGLFTIIVLGESIVGVVAGASESHHISFAIGIWGIFGLALSFSMWWLYFDRIAKRSVKRNPWWLATWVYNHLLLVIGLTAIGAGTLNVVAQDSSYLSLPVVWLICGSVALSFFALAFFEFTLAGELENPGIAKRTAVVRASFGALALLLALLGSSLNAPLILGSLALMAILQIAMLLNYSTHTPQTA